MRRLNRSFILLTSLVFTAPALADSAAISFSTSEGVKTEADTRAAASPESSEGPLPQAPIEFGIFGGLFFPSADHRLFTRVHEEFSRPSAEIGGRVAGYPFQYLGLEVEAAGMPSSTRASDSAGGFWAARGHLLGQIPAGRFSVFGLFGGGVLSAASEVTGSDTDPALHFGLGAKVALDDVLGLRLDLRDTLSQKNVLRQGVLTHHPEVLLGVTFGVRAPRPMPSPPPPPPPDADRDGVEDSSDACKELAGVAPHGCPDTDGDGIFDHEDACSTESGSPPCGCPPRDQDGDRFIDELDRCPDVAGPIEGCPDPDSDRDGVSGEADRCPDRQETRNGFEDDDGCPDEIPEKVKKFTGVIKGIEFDRGTEKIRPLSTPTLDGAASVLTEYPSLRVLISGHTDSDGTREYNLDLSRRRAEAVKAYFVGKGIAEARIETRGVGPDEPIAENTTAANKQKNRRIEFKLLEGRPTNSESGAPPSEPSSKGDATAPNGETTKSSESDSR